MKKVFVIAGLILSVIVLASCGSTTEVVVDDSAVEAETSEAVLTLSGAADMTWSTADLEGMTQTEAEYTNKDGETSTYSGVALCGLISEAGISDFTTATLIAFDGYEAEITSDELSNCDTCIVAVEDDGSLRAVMPDMSSKLQVKGLSEISVQ